MSSDRDSEGAATGYILIVDDDPDTRDVVKWQVEPVAKRYPYRCEACDDGGQALAFVADRGPQIRLAIIDLRMPPPGATGGEIDEDAGIKLCRQIRDQGWSFPIIVHTQRSDLKAKNECGRIHGVPYYVERPWVMKTLREAVQRCLDHDMPAEMLILESGSVLG